MLHVVKVCVRLGLEGVVCLPRERGLVDVEAVMWVWDDDGGSLVGVDGVLVAGGGTVRHAGAVRVVSFDLMGFIRVVSSVL